jgi:uncharacterized Zn finger protein
VAEGDDEEWDWEELTPVLLRVLAREHRYEEYLRLAQATGHNDAFLVMLARLGRVEEAEAMAPERLATPGEALSLARALREQNALDAAVRIARMGLELDAPSIFTLSAGTRADLANWLSSIAEELGNPELVMEATLVAFQEAPELTAYLKLQALAGEEWPALKQQLLQQLRGRHAYSAESQIDIFLHEGLVEDAIQVVDRGYSRSQLERVMDAAIATHPDWVIRSAQREAEAIMDAKKAQYYDVAVKWLRKVKAAYKSTGREAEWDRYLAGIRTEHGRKYKLMGLLKGI